MEKTLPHYYLFIYLFFILFFFFVVLSFSLVLLRLEGATSLDTVWSIVLLGAGADHLAQLILLGELTAEDAEILD